MQSEPSVVRRGKHGSGDVWGQWMVASRVVQRETKCTYTYALSTTICNDTPSIAGGSEHVLRTSGTSCGWIVILRAADRQLHVRDAKRGAMLAVA